MEIDLVQAVLGGTVKVPGIYNDTIMKIPSGTSSHSQICLKGHGIKKLDKHGHGDQFVNIKIKIPK